MRGIRPRKPYFLLLYRRRLRAAFLFFALALLFYASSTFCRFLCPLFFPKAADNDLKQIQARGLPETRHQRVVLFAA